MEGTHYLSMTIANAKIYFFLQDSHSDLVFQIKNSPSHGSRGYPNNHDEYYDQITQWMEQSYSASSIVGNKLQYILMLAKKLRADEDVLARIFRGYLRKGIHKKSKNMYWMVVTHLCAHRQDLPFHVQLGQVFYFLLHITFYLF